MREYNVFKNFVEKHLAVFLPETYRDATIETMVIRKSKSFRCTKRMAWITMA